MAEAFFSDAPEPAEAVLQVSTRMAEAGWLARRRGADPSAAAVVFASAGLAEDPLALSRALDDVLHPLPWIGFVGASAFCGMELAEGRPGLAVLLVDDAGAYARLAAPAELGSYIAAALAADAPRGRARLLSAPASPFDPANLLPSLDEQGVPLAGAVSAGVEAAPTALGPDLQETGSTALLSLDEHDLLIGVAQATRLVGRAHQLTAVDGNILREIDGRPALEALLGDLPTEKAAGLAGLRGQVFAGLATEDGAAYIMHPVLGADPRIGALALTGRPAAGAEVVFGLLDGQAARDDLEATLHSLKETLGGRRPEAVILFDAAARGEGLMGVPLYDVERTLDILGGDAGTPVVGAFGSGEVATLGARSYGLGHTAVIAALLRR